MTQGLVGGLPLVVAPNVQYWVKHCLTYSSMTGLKEQIPIQQVHCQHRAGMTGQYPRGL